MNIILGQEMCICSALIDRATEFPKVAVPTGRITLSKWISFAPCVCKHAIFSFFTLCSASTHSFLPSAMFIRHSVLRSMKILEIEKTEKKYEKRLRREDKERGKGKTGRII